MKKKFLASLLIAGLLFTSVSPAVPVQAAGLEPEQITTESGSTDPSTSETPDNNGNSENSGETEQPEVHTHQAASWTVVTPATETSDGLETATCSECGEVMEQTISHPAAVVFPKSEYAYIAKARKPAFDLVDADGNVIEKSQYSSVYTNNKMPGKASVTVTLNTDRYQASLKKTFKIVLPQVTFTTLKTRTEGFKAFWETQSKYITGYQVQWSTSSDFSKDPKASKVKPKTADNLIVRKLKSKTTYYVRVRAYMEAPEKTYTSAWSPAMSVRTKESKYVKLVAVGDDLLHSPVYQSMKTSKGYNFEPMFAHIKDDVKAADLAVINQETILVKSNYTSYPCFGSPLKVADAIHKAGFNVVTCATNHTMDRGTDAITTTMNYWKKNYPDTTILGIHESQKDADTVKVVEKNGVKIAMLNYTYGLNGFTVPSGKSYMIDLLGNKTRMHNMIQKAKKQSDFVIVFAHWGVEYVYTPDRSAVSWAEFFADEGVDLVIGGHPHVLEPIKKVKGKNGNEMVCYYSLGNFISAQGNVPRLLGGMADVTIVKDSDGTRVKTSNMIPLVTHLTNGSTPYTTYKLEDYTEDLARKNHIHNRSSETFTVARLKSLYKSIMNK